MRKKKLFTPKRLLTQAVENVRYLHVHAYLSDGEKRRVLARIRKEMLAAGLEFYEPKPFRFAFRKAGTRAKQQRHSKEAT